MSIFYRPTPCSCSIACSNFIRDMLLRSEPTILCRFEHFYGTSGVPTEECVHFFESSLLK
jgi:hypothetical protein